MLLRIILKVYVCLVLLLISAVENVNNITLIPSQILLPQTTYYVSPRTKESIKISVEVLLRVEPRLCVNWELQNSGILHLLPQTEDDNYMDSVASPSISNRCYNTIRVRTVSSNVLVEPVRTWIFAYDNLSKTKASTEVLISPMSKIQFETRNRRISVDQIVTLRIVGLDSYNNTFTSLEGIPFEAKVENEKIMQIVDLRKDPDVSTIGRISLLDKGSAFSTTSGYILTSDVIILQGKSVGKTKISLRVMLPEYKNIILNDVEFTVSDSIILDPSRIILSPSTKFKFCLLSLQTPNLSTGTINYSNYSWSTDSAAKSVSVHDGLLKLSSYEQNFKVFLEDKRNGEVFTSHVSVKTPYSLNISYDLASNSNVCFSNKGVNVKFVNSYANYFENVYNYLYSNCLGSLHCGKFINSDNPTLYLLKGRTYILDLSLKDKDGLNIYITADASISWLKVDDNLVKVSWKSANGRMLLLDTLDEGTFEATVTLNNIKMNVKIVITLPVELVDYPLLATNSPTDFNASKKPMILSNNETVALKVTGGSGEYEFKLDGNMAEVKSNKLTTKDYGTSVLTIVDKLDLGNVYKIQVIVSKISSIKVSDLYVEKGNVAPVELLCFADLSSVTPIFTDKWDFNQFYFCPNAFASKSSFTADLSFDKSLLELAKVTSEPGLVLHFRGNDIGKGLVSVKVYEDSMKFVATFSFHVYEPLTVTIHPFHAHLPLKVVPPPVRNKTQEFKAVFASVPVGGSVKIIVSGGPPDRKGLKVTSSLDVLHVEKETEDTFDIYCMDEINSATFSVEVDSVKREFNVSCKIPQFIEIVPLDYGTQLNEGLLKLQTNSDVQFLPSKNLATFEKTWNIFTNVDEWHVFYALAFDQFGMPLLPSYSWKFNWNLSKSINERTIKYDYINNALFIYKSDELLNYDLTLKLEWSVLDSKHTPPKVVSKFDTRRVNNILSSYKSWSKGRNLYTLTDSFNITPRKPHQILLSTNEGQSDKISIFYEPNVKYQFAVVMGSGNYVEELNYDGGINFNYTSFNFNTFQEFEESLKNKDVINLFNLDKFNAKGPIMGKFVNFVVQEPSSRSFGILDRYLYWQHPQGLFISVAPVAKLAIIIKDTDNNVISHDNLALLVLKKQYKVQVIGWDVNGIEMCGLSFRNLKFDTVNTNIQFDPELNTISVASEGKYTFRVDVSNSKSSTTKGNIVNTLIELIGYKEIKPIVSSLVLLPNSSPLEVAVMKSAIDANLKLKLEHSDDAVVTILNDKISTNKVGNTSIDSYVVKDNKRIGSKYTLSTIVAVPSSATLTTVPTVLQGKSVTLVTDLFDRYGNKFTRLYLGGSDLNKAYCTFEWNADGGYFMVRGAKVNVMSGVGKNTAQLFSDLRGTITVYARVTCKNLSAYGSVELTTPRTRINCVGHVNIFSDEGSTPVTLATDSIYHFKGGDIQVTCATNDLLNVVSDELIETKSKCGHLLLKTQDSTLHVQVENVGLLAIESVDKLDVVKGANKTFKVFLKAKNGQDIVTPYDVKYKIFSSDESLLNTIQVDDSIKLFAGLNEGCALLSVQLDEYSNDTLVMDTVRVCVVNALIPQDLTVLKGTSVRFLASNTTGVFTITLSGKKLFNYLNIEHNDTLKQYQNGFKEDDFSVIRGDLTKALNGMSLKHNFEIKEIHYPILEFVTGPDHSIALYTFPITTNYRDDIHVLINSLNQYVKDSNLPVFSLVHGGVYPLYDIRNGWDSNASSTFWAKDAQGVALYTGDAVVSYNFLEEGGKSKISIVDSIQDVQVKYACDERTDDLKNYIECFKPFYIIFNAKLNNAVLKNDYLVDYKLLPVCKFTDLHLSKIFTFESHLYKIDNNYYPSCKILPRIVNSYDEWLKLKDLLANTVLPNNPSLDLLLYTTIPKDYNSFITFNKFVQTTVRRHDKLLWNQTVKWTTPQMVAFVDGTGKELDHLLVPRATESSTSLVTIYPYNTSLSITINSKQYTIKDVEKRGLYYTFNVLNQGVAEPAILTVTCRRNILGTLKITTQDDVKATVVIERVKYQNDFLLTIFTGFLATILIYLIYSHSNRTKFYEPTVPIKIERNLPNVFEKICQSNYIGTIAHHKQIHRRG